MTLELKLRDNIWPFDENAFYHELQQAKKQGLLPDQFKSPLHVMWELTSRCNQQCVHCFNDSGSSRLNCDLELDKLVDIADELIRLQIIAICMTGGEVLLLGDTFFQLAHKLRNAGIMIGMVTNGMLVEEKVGRKLGECFDRVQVSIDGACAETHDFIRGRSGAFKKALNALDVLAANNIEVSVAFTVCDRNYAEVDHFIELMVERKCVEIVRFQPMAAIGRGNKCLISPPDRKKWDELVEKINLIRQELSKKLMIQCLDPTLQIVTMRDEKVPNFFVEIMSNGQVRGSPYIPLISGDLRINTLEEIWHDNKLCDFWSLDCVQEMTKHISWYGDFCKGDYVAWVDDIVNPL
ncbi:MAG: hypothetical protein DRZ76_02445 [Candidatus Nealsonbacteria bacterium]|nr:MAG: hypothetical protein DRZ76_02445 [Candidatus Nealsonbacteria bacterium]